MSTFSFRAQSLGLLYTTLFKGIGQTEILKSFQFPLYNNKDLINGISFHNIGQI